jgi:hypothetical protein
MADKNGSRPRVSRQPEGPQLNIQEIDYQISFDVPAFDSFIKSQGIWVTHYRALPDPRGMSSLGDNRHTLASRQSNSDGFMYNEAGKLQVLFSANSKNVDIRDMGELASSTAYMTLPRHYQDGTDVVVHAWDRFYLADIEIKVSTTQFVEASKKGIDRLQYPAVKVNDLMDANGVSYKQDVDFTLNEGGDIVWTTQRRPGWDASLGKGTVYSVRYLYTPYFIVSRHLHEIRVSQVTNPRTYSRSLERMPYQIQVLRENVFLDAKSPAGLNTPDARASMSPAIGGGGQVTSTGSANLSGNSGAVGMPTMGPKT